MKDRQYLERSYRAARRKRVYRRIFIYTAIALGMMLAAYLSYDIPARSKRAYDILVRDYEWRRARLEKPYRAVEDQIGNTRLEGTNALDAETAQ